MVGCGPSKGFVFNAVYPECQLAFGVHCVWDYCSCEAISRLFLAQQNNLDVVFYSKTVIAGAPLRVVDEQ